MHENDAIARGRELRRQVLGDRHVAAKASDPFLDAFRTFTETHCWGNVWVRDGLSLKTRSMLNVSMLCVLGRWHELGVHIHGARNNGVTEEEISEILLQAGVYGGVPVASEGFRVASEAIARWNNEDAAAQGGESANS